MKTKFLKALVLCLTAFSAVSCYESRESTYGEIYGSWSPTEIKIMSDGAEVPESGVSDHMGSSGGITYVFSNDGTCAYQNLGLSPSPVTGNFVYSEITHKLTITISDSSGFLSTSTETYVESITNKEMVWKQTDRSASYFKDGFWHIEADSSEKHTLEITTILTRL